MSIAPVIRIVDVKTPPARSFALFTGSMGRWWPSGRTPGGKPHVEIVVEPHGGGRWFERDADGTETQWGYVIAWKPPEKLLLGWQLDSTFQFDPALVTEVEISFAPLPGGGTRVRLEHRHLERLGADAVRVAERIGTGWPARLAEFQLYAAAQNA